MSYGAICGILILLISAIVPCFTATEQKERIIQLDKGTTTMEFPPGTIIEGVRCNIPIDLKSAAGIKNGISTLFLTIYAKERANATITYKVPELPTFKKNVYELLIIAPSPWTNDLEKLVTHKEECGIRTILVNLDDIYDGRYTTVNGKDDAEKIKYFIKAAIEEWGIKYVMLVGGKNICDNTWWMPVRYIWLNDRSSSWEYERRFLSDLYFADIYDANGAFSTWDSNNNGYYGEYDHEIKGNKLFDIVDLVPDVYVGRLAARSRFELQNVINSIIQYENTPTPEQLNAVLCGGDLYLHDPWNISEGEYLLDALAEHLPSCTITKCYASQGLTASVINDALTAGADIAVFEGAGNGFLWATHAKDNDKWIFYRPINILQIKNECLPIVLTSGARLGQFNQTRACFNWFFVASGRAVASIGSTGLCWVGHGKNVTDMFLGNLHLRLAEHMTQGCFLGTLWGNALCDYLCNFSWQGVAAAFHMKAAEELEVFGDPTLKIGGYNRMTMSINSVLHVGGNGKGNYTSIQNAIDNARNGDTIIVHPGIYNEDLTINTTVALVGKDATIKTHGGLLLANDIKIDGFNVEGYGNANGFLCEGTNALLKNNSFSGFNISLFIRADDCSVVENILMDSQCGIWVNDAENTIIKNNAIKNVWYGIWGERAYHPSITNNVISYNEWYAIWMEGREGYITDNIIHNSWYSLFMNNAYAFELKNNTILQNMQGVEFVNSSNNIVKDNTVKENEHYGICLGSKSIKNTIIHNNFINNSQNAKDYTHNTWDGNYWSNYIGLKLRICYYLRVPCYVPSGSFDWHPTTEPYE